MEVNLEKLKSQCAAKYSKAWDEVIHSKPDAVSKGFEDKLYSSVCLLSVESRLQLQQQHADRIPPGEPQIAFQGDDILRSLLSSCLRELQEFRDCYTELSPILRDSQMRVKALVFHYARKHSIYSKHAQYFQQPPPPLSPSRYRTPDQERVFDESHFLRRARSLPLTRSKEIRDKSIWRRAVNSVIKLISPRKDKKNKKNAEEDICNEFQDFYVMNGKDFKPKVNQMMVRCEQLDKMLFKLKIQLRQVNQVPLPSAAERTLRIGGASGLAFIARIPQGRTAQWVHDVQFVWREARNVKKMLNLMPAPGCWQAIFNILMQRGNESHYI